MSDFSERFGYRPPPVDLPDHGMPQSLRAGLWDAFRMSYAESIDRRTAHGGYDPSFRDLTDQIWFHFFREPIDSRPQYPYQARDVIRSKVLSDFRSHELYSFLEFVARLHYKPDEDYGESANAKEFIRFCNQVLERERAAFRFSGPQLVKLTDENALEEIELASVQSSV